jgi:hypothetical protein
MMSFIFYGGLLTEDEMCEMCEIAARGFCLAPLVHTSSEVKEGSQSAA